MRSYRTVSPLPEPAGDFGFSSCDFGLSEALMLNPKSRIANRKSPVGHRRSVLCGTFPVLTDGGCYPPPCPVEPGLSSTAASKVACRRSGRSPHSSVRIVRLLMTGGQREKNRDSTRASEVEVAVAGTSFWQAHNGLSHGFGDVGCTRQLVVRMVTKLSIAPFSPRTVDDALLTPPHPRPLSPPEAP